jgi:hypothetical protein
MNTALIQRDFDGHAFLFREDGYFNMTKAAKLFGKKLSHFWDSADTKAYLEAFQDLFAAYPNFGVAKQVVKGNQFVPDAGTYGHPKLAVFFARWLDVRFAVWCDMTIDSILQGKLEVSVAEAHKADPEVALLREQLGALKAGVWKLTTAKTLAESPQ